MNKDVVCPYRYNIRGQGHAEVATCGLLKQVTKLADDTLFDVHQEACARCVDSLSLHGRLANPVIPSLLFTICDRAQSVGNLPDLQLKRVEQLQQWALDSLMPTPTVISPASCCDVVLCCCDDSPETHRSIQSILEQEDAFPILHLVDDGGAGDAVVRHYSQRPNVLVRRNPTKQGTFATLHELVPHLKTQYVAVQDARTVSRQDRLAHCISILEQRGAELVGAALKTPDGVVQPRLPAVGFDRFIPAQTLVFRRASLVDLGGFALRDGDEDAELVYRAYQEDRPFALTDYVTVEQITGNVQPTSIGAAPSYQPRDGSLRHHARGWSTSNVACDVVLPFHGDLEFAGQALQSLIEQDRADVVIHLIDDQSPVDTSGFMRFWSTHPQLRIYRNTSNIGPFASFNNVVPFAETDFVAVQDADDISLPNRLCHSGNQLRLSGADIFGARTETFGEEQIMRPTSTVTSTRTRTDRPRFRWSYYPGIEIVHYLENPTAMIRVASFEQLGGYADFGELQRNRTAVDTEFFTRAYYANAAFAISRDIVLRYRYHMGSATQHPETGWGSRAHNTANLEHARRLPIFRSRRFDPRMFGALTRFRGTTQRLET